MYRQLNGFTLIELLVTLTIAAILLAIASPSLSNFYARYRAESNIKLIQQTLMLARNHAITLGKKVTVCALVNNECDANWQSGLTAFIDINGNYQLDSNEHTIFVTNAFSQQDVVICNRIAFRFRPDGLASGTNGTLKYCPSDIHSPYSKSVIVNQAGRARVSTAKGISCE